MRKTIKTEYIANRYVLLKCFDALTVNEKVPAHKHQNGLWHIYFKGNWHEVPEADIEIL